MWRKFSLNFIFSSAQHSSDISSSAKSYKKDRQIKDSDAHNMHKV